MTNTENIQSVTCHGNRLDTRTGEALSYSATFEPDTFLGPLVSLDSDWSRDGGNFPAEDLDAVIYALTELRTKMRGQS